MYTQLAQTESAAVFLKLMWNDPPEKEGKGLAKPKNAIVVDNDYRFHKTSRNCSVVL